MGQKSPFFIPFWVPGTPNEPHFTLIFYPFSTHFSLERWVFKTHFLAVQLRWMLIFDHFLRAHFWKIFKRFARRSEICFF